MCLTQTKTHSRQIEACMPCRKKYAIPKRVGGRRRSADLLMALELGVTKKVAKALGGAEKWHAMSDDARKVMLNMTKRRKYDDMQLPLDRREARVQ
jgi:hypothetical protein